MSKSISSPKPNILHSGFSFGGPLESILPEHLLTSDSLTTCLPLKPGTDQYWMREALKVSLKGAGVTNPNPAVGCVIVDRHGNELSRGFTQPYPGKHAERHALDQIQDPQTLVDATAYVTLEPCSHTGNQPPCVDALASSPIQRIVIARPDPFHLVNGTGIQKLEKTGKQVHLGIYSTEVTAWNFPFFAYQFLKRPVVVLKWAQTIDGQLADDLNQARWISGPLSRAYTHWLRQRYDAILVGAKTLLTDLPTLTVRDSSPWMVRDPMPVILDPRGMCLKMPTEKIRTLSERVLAPDRPILYCTTKEALQKHPQGWITEREKTLTFTFPTNEIIPDLLTFLAEPQVKDFLGRPVQSLFVEGGPSTLSLFLKNGAADLLHVFIAPKITGGLKNRISTHRLLQEASTFHLASQFHLGADSVLELVDPDLFERVFNQK